MKQKERVKIMATALAHAAAESTDEQRTKVLENFLLYVKGHKLFYLLPKIILALEEIILTKENKIRVDIDSKFELNKSELVKIIDLVAQKSGKKVVIKQNLKEELIGGVAIKYGDKILDLTVKKMLGQLKRELVK